MPLGKVLCLLFLTAFFPSVISTCYLSESSGDVITDTVTFNGEYLPPPQADMRPMGAWVADQQAHVCWALPSVHPLAVQPSNPTHRRLFPSLFKLFLSHYSPSCSLSCLLTISSVTSRHHSRTLDSRAGAPVPLTPKPNLPRPALVCVEIM